MIDYKIYNSGTVYDIDLELPPEERWNSVIDATGDEIYELHETITKLKEELLSSLILPPALSAILTAGSGWLMRCYSSMVWPEHYDEIKGMADYTKLDPNDLFFANVLYDLYSIGNACSACSSYSFNLRGRQPCLARNVDWDEPNTIGHHTVMLKFHRKGKSYYAVGILGLVGVLSAMLPHQWAITMNMAPPAWEYSGVLGRTPALHHIRHVCDQFGAFGNVVNRLQEYRTVSPFFAHVVGVKPQQHKVVTSYGSEYDVRVAKDNFLVQTNHYVDVSEEIEQHNPPAETDEEGFYYDTYERYDAIHRRFKKHRPTSMKTALNPLRRHPVTSDATMQTMVFCPATSKYHLEVREPK